MKNKDLTSAKYGQLWTRDELIMAFDLYCRIPFQQTKANNPQVRELAHILSRTPAAVARKLGNFGAFDPALNQKGISGLVHVSKLDKEIWDEFNLDWNSLIWEAHRLLQKYSSNESQQFKLPQGPSEKIRETKVRVHQIFFSRSCTEQ